jgi:hypothetical protein
MVDCRSALMPVRLPKSRAASATGPACDSR